MRRRTPAMLVTLALVMTAAPATPGVPDPARSSIDSHLVLCPLGDHSFRGALRDAAGNPWPHSILTIDVGPCVTMDFCPAGARDGYDLGLRAVRWGTDAQGRYDVRLRGGGICDVSVEVRADGVLMAVRRPASYDQNGDRVVDGTDETIVAAKVGTNDTTADFDGDGAATDSDLAQLGEHRGHACEMPVRARPGTWGLLKTTYR